MEIETVAVECASCALTYFFQTVPVIRPKTIAIIPERPLSYLYNESIKPVSNISHEGLPPLSRSPAKLGAASPEDAPRLWPSKLQYQI